MLLGGDEFGRSQGGNNNAWCQDNDISWFHWERGERGERLLEFTRRLIRLRHEHPVFRRRQFLHGTEEEGSGLPDVWWFRPDGRRMTKRDWDDGEGQLLGMFLNGEEIATPDPQGRRIVDDSFVLLFNANHEDHDFTLPGERFGDSWEVVLRTDEREGDGPYDPGAPVTVVARSLVLLRRIA
jgi:glycogen operon protein